MSLPRHLAIIMDGNGRWAAGRGQPRVAGHKAGIEPVRMSHQGMRAPGHRGAHGVRVLQ